ncbi:MAG: fatty acid cis/trans isomerase, partial [Bdellovibrionales bacterium]|nr:fatty acid cis/trans isomerase [Bdellovibrionales bacterium]
FLFFFLFFFLFLVFFLIFFIILFLIINKNINQNEISTTQMTDLHDMYSTEIQPIFNQKCIACHSCFNAPCQLNLTSYEGVNRGASKLNIYDFPKFKSRDPSRLYIDAHTAKEWREKEFFSVTENKQNSLLLYLISKPEGIESGKQKTYDAEYSRQCIASTDKDEIKKFTKKNKAGRMPLGLPALSESEVQKIYKWVNEGAKGPKLIELEGKIISNKFLSHQINELESFLNQKNIKYQITSRYLYEHLFLANLYFKNVPNIFFRLVRSKSSTGNIEEIGSALPFDDPKINFFYRLRPVTNAMMHKYSIPFALDSELIKTWKKNFIESKWPISPKEMPKYGAQAANPFDTFKMIPSQARYNLFLNFSYYFVMTFIKGPVCRGQTALNVINDHFWVLFLDPSKDPLLNNSDAYQKISNETAFPSEIGDDFSPLINFKEKYWKAVTTKFQYLSKMGPLDLNSIWSGKKENPNSALTVYRHFDSASVLYGLRGKIPKTIWILDYQVFESIYYNLTAGYNTFGPLLHQLNSRLYMEVSRIASEDLFLSFLPKKDRQNYRSQWNISVPPHKETITKEIFDLFSTDAKEKLKKEYQYAGVNIESQILLDQEDSKKQLLNQLIKNHFSPSQTQRIESDSKKVNVLTQLNSSITQYLPDTIFLLIRSKNKKSSELWTIVHNKAHYNVAMLLFEKERRRPEFDTVDIIRGAATSYINLIIEIKEEKLPFLYKDLSRSKNQNEINNVLRKYSLSRTNPNFWDIFQEVSSLTKNTQTNEQGTLDLNRYINL